ncbi:MAG: rhomboid family intramembrane serine protease [Chitinophagaceae bacterium]|nr:rhomboid family intramembrane serine protease [Chitinophagaceae bacterium]
MPKHEAILNAPHPDRKTSLVICYYAFKQLGWQIQFAGETALSGLAPKNTIGWKKYNVQITAGYNEQDNFFVVSEMIHDEMMDVTGINKKRVEEFEAALEVVKEKITAEEIETGNKAIDELRAQTIQVFEEETKRIEEINTAMNLGNGNMYVTYAIIAINALVFILMVLDGAGLFTPNGLVHLKWGSNFKPLTQSGDWWRLLTCVFIHFGIIHLALNMYALFSVGVYLEPMLGKVKYITAYLCTGVLASLASLWWHTEPTNSAGASGAVFGMYGLFLALLTSNLIPKSVRQALLQSIGIFVVYNLIYGLKGGVNNAAHIGGLISGLLIGYIYVFAIKKEKEEEPVKWVTPAVIIITIAAVVLYLQQNKSTEEERRAIKEELSIASYKDAEKYNDKLKRFGELEEKAMNAMNDTVSNEQLIENMKNITAKAWVEAEGVVQSMQQMNVSEVQHKKADLMLKYVQLRKKETDFRISFAGSPSDAIKDSIISMVNRINSVVERIH